MSTKTKKRTGIVDDKMFNELLESVKQAGAIMRGEMKPSRRFVYDSLKVEEIRKKLIKTAVNRR